MSFDFGGSFDAGSIDSAPTDVPADVNVDPSSADYGSEQLTTDQAANPGDQVANQSGNSDFVNATDPAATDTAPAATNAGSTTQTFDDGSTLTTNADGTISATNAPSYTLESLQAKAGSLIDQAQGAVQKQLSQISLEKIAKTAVGQIQNTAINLVKQTANQALSTVVGPAAAATITGGVSRSIAGALSGNATPVNSSTNPQSPNFVGPPAPSSVNNSPAPTNDGSTTQTLDDGSTITTYPDGRVTSTPAVGDPTTSPKPTNDGSTTQTLDDGSTITTYPDGRVTSTPAPADPTANPGAVSSATDPTLATQPANPGAATVANNNTVNATDAGLVGPPVSLANTGSIAAAAAANAALVAAGSTTRALLTQAQQQQTARQQYQNQAQSGDWRVRLSLAPSSNYLYNDPNCGPVLWPLYLTGGVIFPYTPSIDLGYKANYTPYDLTHSNYRGYFYQNSYVDGINIKATFTAQDTAEANYLLAVIHFFRSVTKMFYGQDAQAGSPPPLVFLSGLGDFQFNQHPCVVSQFNYSLPADVNYIRAQNVANNGTNQLAARTRNVTLGNPISNAIQRLASLGQGINPGALTAPYAPQGSLAAGNPTYVPTKMDITLVLLPMQSRGQVSQQFSLKAFANGNLLKGGFW